MIQVAFLSTWFLFPLEQKCTYIEMVFSYLPRFKFKILATLKHLVFNGDDFKISTYFATYHFRMEYLSQTTKSKKFLII